MVIKKYDIDIQKKAIIKNLDRITNQIFKLLPNREEGQDWKTPLENLIIELGGMAELLEDQVDLFSLLCKMQALFSLDAEEDFPSFRKVIFECLSLITEVKKCLG